MPISQINPDGSVKIYNKQTGQQLDVSPQDLPKYNPALVSDYQTRLKQQQDTQAALQMVKAGTPIADIKAPDPVKFEVQKQALQQGVQIPDANTQKATATKKQQADDAKSLIQATLQNYLNVPQGERTGLGYKANIPIAGRFLAPNATEYENGVKGEAPALGKVFGGAGSGLKITQPEINSWTPFLPSIHKTDEQNAADVQRLDTILKSRTGEGLDASYLQQFGVKGQQPQQGAPAQAGQPQAQAPQQPGVASQIGGLLGNILKPATDFGKMVGGAGYEAVRAGASALGDKNAYNPSVHQNPFLNEQELQKYANPINGLKTTAGAASYAIPFGGGAGILTKALLPGAVAGGLQAASQDNATPQSVAGNAVLGAGGAGILHGLLKLPGLAGKAGGVVQNAGTDMRQGVSKIDLPAGLNAAAREKQIQAALDSQGITGSAAEKYAKIGPAANKLYTDVINPVLDKNPKPVNTQGVINNFTDYLDKNKVSLGISGNKAKQAATSFMQDIYGQGGKKILPTDIPTDRLFQLKQDLSANQGMGKIFNKLHSADAAPLSNEEKVKLAAWKTLDDIISKQHPEIKDATRTYGLLKESADSLHAARNAPAPAMQVLGTKVPVPGGIVQKATDLTGRGLQGAGKTLTKGGVSVHPVIRQMASQIAAHAAASQQ